jgi:cell division septum initiation protein DivIVA
MLSFETTDTSTTPTEPDHTLVQVGDLEVVDLEVDATTEVADEVDEVKVDDTAVEAEPLIDEDDRARAARTLELAAVTADRLVADAEAEAASLVATARAEADVVLETSREESRQAAAALARTKADQIAELDRERDTALTGISAEKVALEAQVATLRQLQSDHRSLMRQHLTEQLSLLDAAVPEPPAAVAG